MTPSSRSAFKTPVVTTGLCFGTPMTKHLADLGSSDTVPDGWYFGDYGYSYFVPEDASGMTTYLDKIKQYGAPDVEYTGFAGPIFANLMTVGEVLQPAGPGRVRRRHQALDDQDLQGSDDDHGRTDELRLSPPVLLAVRYRDGNHAVRTASGRRSRPA